MPPFRKDYYTVLLDRSLRSLPFSEKEKGAVQGGFLGCNCVKNRDNCTSLLDFPDEI